MHSRPPLALFLVLALLAGGCAGPKAAEKKRAHRGYVTEIDLTRPTSFDVEAFGGAQSLREFEPVYDPEIKNSYVFGKYRGPMDLTGGDYFHFFPDGGFAIEEFSDIGLPVTVASRRWKFDGHALAVYNLVERNDARRILGMKWVKEHFGPVDRIRLFVTGNGDAIGNTILVADAIARKGKHVKWQYLSRLEYYRNWPKERQRLLKK